VYYWLNYIFRIVFVNDCVARSDNLDPEPEGINLINAVQVRHSAY